MEKVLISIFYNMNCCELYFLGSVDVSGLFSLWYELVYVAFLLFLFNIL